VWAGVMMVADANVSATTRPVLASQGD
jgi:hypothetical protein